MTMTIAEAPFPPLDGVAVTTVDSDRDTPMAVKPVGTFRLVEPAGIVNDPLPRFRSGVVCDRVTVSPPVGAGESNVIVQNVTCAPRPRIVLGENFTDVTPATLTSKVACSPPVV